MSSPLSDLYGQTPSRSGAGGSPLSDLYGAAPQGQAQPQEITPGGPAQEPITAGDRMQQAQSRSELSALEMQDVQDHVRKLNELLARKDISPKQRERLTKMRDRYKVPTVLGMEVINRPGKFGDDDRGVVENIARGAGHGVVNLGLLGAADLVAGAGQLVLPKSLEHMIGLPEWRNNLAEARTILEEDFFQHEGKAGAVGAVAGIFAPAGVEGVAARKGWETIARSAQLVNPYGVFNSAGLKAMTKIPVIGPIAAATVVKGTQPGATYLQRLSANLIGSGAVDVVQAADILTMEGVDGKQKAAMLLAAVGTSSGVAALQSLRPNKIGGSDLVRPKAVEEPAANPARAAEADELTVGALRQQKKAEFTARLKRAARAQWEVENPDKTWKSLSKDERAAVVDRYTKLYGSIDREDGVPSAPGGVERPEGFVSTEGLLTGEAAGKPGGDAEPGVGSAERRLIDQNREMIDEYRGLVKEVEDLFNAAAETDQPMSDDITRKIQAAKKRIDDLGNKLAGKGLNPDRIAPQRPGEPTKPPKSPLEEGAEIRIRNMRVEDPDRFYGLLRDMEGSARGGDKNAERIAKWMREYDNWFHGEFGEPGLSRNEADVDALFKQLDDATFRRHESSKAGDIEDVDAMDAEIARLTERIKELGGFKPEDSENYGFGKAKSQEELERQYKTLKAMNDELMSLDVSSAEWQELIEDIADLGFRYGISPDDFQWYLETGQARPGTSPKRMPEKGAYNKAKKLYPGADDRTLLMILSEQKSQLEKLMNSGKATPEERTRYFDLVEQWMAVRNKLGGRLDYSKPFTEKQAGIIYDASSPIDRLEQFGTTKAWKDLTPEERALHMEAIENARQEIDRATQGAIDHLDDQTYDPDQDVARRAQELLDELEGIRPPDEADEPESWNARQERLDAEDEGLTRDTPDASESDLLSLDSREVPIRGFTPDEVTGLADVIERLNKNPNDAKAKAELNQYKQNYGAKYQGLLDAALDYINATGAPPRGTDATPNSDPAAPKGAKPGDATPPDAPRAEGAPPDRTEIADAIGEVWLALDYSPEAIVRQRLAELVDVLDRAGIKHDKIDPKTIGLDKIPAFMTKVRSLTDLPSLSAEGPADVDARIKQLQDELAQTRNERDEARRAAETDALTGLGNKDAWTKAHAAADADPNLEIVFFDITNFKAWNDAYGNVEGDKLLADYGAAVRTALESVDAPVRAFRQGDEFFAIVPKGKADEVIRLAQQIGGKTAVNGFEIGFRASKGDTFEMAILGQAEVKAMETGAKNRDVSGKKGGEFYGIKIKKPLHQMSEAELERLTLKLDKLVDQGKIDPDTYLKAMKEIANADRARSSGEAPPSAEATGTQGVAEETPPAKVELPPDPGAPARTVSKGKKPEDAKIFDDPASQRARGERIRRLAKSDLTKLTVEDLMFLRDFVQQQFNGQTKIERQMSGVAEQLAKIQEEIARRASEGGSGGGIVLQTHPAVTGFAAGFAAGMYMPADDAQERWRNALYLGAAGSLGAAAYLRRLKKAAHAALPPHQQNIRKHVKSIEDRPLERREGIYTHLMRAYGSIARRDIGITNVSKLAGTKNLPAGQSAGKMAELFGRWRGMADRWILGDRLGYFTNEGEWVQLDGKTITQIAGDVRGDLRSVGDLAAARLELTLRNQPDPRTTGLKLEDARRMYSTSSEMLHKGAEELSKYFRALKSMSVAAGLLSKEASAKMDEQAFYVAIRRLFEGEVGTTPDKIDVKSSGATKSVGPEQLFKYLKGSKLPYQNPVEAAIDLTPRYMRAAELNRLAVQFFDEIRALPAADRRLIVRPLTSGETPKIANEDLKVAAMKKMLADQGNDLSTSEIRMIVASLSDESLNITSDVVRIYRNGQMEAWQVSEPVARSFRALQPHELDAVMTGLGIATKPTNFARVGITANPVFVGYQAFRDIWQYYMNGIYSPTPDANPVTKTLTAPIALANSGAHSILGWLHIMFRSGEYRNMLDAGSGGESVASQGLQVVRGNIRESDALLKKIKEGPTRNQFEQIAREIKQMNFREAYASMLQPIADAGRVGAYLHERGRGADVLEALFRAKKAGANFSNRGDALAIQALNRMTLFLNPAIQGVDASRYAFMRDPFGYVVRGIVGLSLPTMYLWAAYRDDEEIQQLRGTAYGKKFWWLRVNGKIVKIPRQLFEGPVFAASVEAWLDHKYEEDPRAVRQWMEAMWNDASVNLLPFIGVVPTSLATGKIVGLGSDIIPPSTKGLDVEFRARENSTAMARIASRATGSLARKLDTEFTSNMLSPAGYDFIVQQYLGGLGSELSRSLSIAMEVQNGADLPPKEELPFVRSVFGRYPTLGVRAIEEFYAGADRSYQTANTVMHIANSNPEQLADYMQQRQVDLMLADMYAKGRRELADMRRAVDDIRQAPREVISDAEKRELTQLYLRQMILRAQQANEMARMINQQVTTTAGR